MSPSVIAAQSTGGDHSVSVLQNNPIPSSIGSNNNNNNNSSNSSSGNNMTTSTAIATTSESGMLKITYEKQPNSRIAQLQDDVPARRSRYVYMINILVLSIKLNFYFYHQSLTIK